MAKKKKKKKTQPLATIVTDGKGGREVTYHTSADRRKMEEEEKSRVARYSEGYVNKGLFEDGYDFGDVAKTLIGTGTDLLEDVKTGAAKVGERVADLGATTIGGIAERRGNEKLADTMQDFVGRNLVEEQKLDKTLKVLPIGRSVSPGMDLLNALVNKGETEKASIAGEKTDAMAQSAGQLAVTAGLQAAGVPWFLTTGATGFGAGAEEAFKGGGTYKDAAIYGGISAGSEILFEKLGGIKFAGKALDSGVKRKLSDAISNKVGKSLINLGMDAAAEGTEEVLTEITQNLGKKLTFEDEKTWKEIMASEEALEGYVDSFVAGSVMGTGFSAGKAVRSAVTGRDYETGLTENETKLVKQVANERIAELQKEKAVEEHIRKTLEEESETFGKLSEKEKKEMTERIRSELDMDSLDYSGIKIKGKERTKIEDEVIEDLKNGQIDIEKIEMAFSADKTNKLNQLLQDYEKADESARQRLAGEIATLKGERAEEIKERIKGDAFIQHSYKQEMMKKEDFVREEKDSDSDITKALAESARRAGMNNTKRMHDLFDYTDKIANDSGAEYAFVNNEQLKKLGHDVEGKTINGLVRTKEDGKTKVLINVDSDKALNVIIGHETTHLLEGTDDYAALQNMVKEYASTRGEYDSRLKATQELYQGVDANIENEVTADLVGEYLFTDEQFISELSTKQSNIFKKVYDYIKHIYKMATAGSKEARQLAQVKRKFDKAYKSIEQSTKALETGTKYSIVDIKGQKQDYGKGVLLDTDIFDGLHPREWNKVLKRYVYENLAGAELTVYNNGRSESIYVAKKTDRAKKHGSQNANRVIDKISRNRTNDGIKSKAIIHVDELAKTSGTVESKNTENSHAWLDQNGWEFRKVYLEDTKGVIYEATLNIANGRDKKILYDITKIKEVDRGDVPSKAAQSKKTTSTQNITGSKTKSNDKLSISDANEIVLPTRNYTVHGKDVKKQAEKFPLPIREDAKKTPKERKLLPTKEDIEKMEAEKAAKADVVAPDTEDTSSMDDMPVDEAFDALMEEAENMSVNRATVRKNRKKALLAEDKEFLEKAMDNAKNKSRIAMNNADTIRVQEIVFGRENGSKVNEIIFQKAINNEARSILWQNKQRNEIKELGIKPRSKMSAAVQKYGEKQYVNEYGDVVPYGETELKQEFPDAKDREKIIKAARIIREKYDQYIDMTNSVFEQLGFDPIPKRENYMRHFQALGDVFSKHGIPFNPESMKEFRLPTDINGLTEFWSPNKNFFANLMPRKGIRTEYDAVTGIDGYISGVSNLIFHTEDIQRGRALEDMIRERYAQGQEEDALNMLAEEERADRINKANAGHLSDYAAWVHEWTNNMAGKKNKADRAVEEWFGRRGFAVLDTIRKQVGANMIGLNFASSLTNLISPVQAISKTNKLAVGKGMIDTFKNIVKKDGFVDQNMFLTSRFGTDMLSKNTWQKMQDKAYFFMTGIDHFSSNLIVRSKYHELIAKGMDEKTAHAEAGKFAARIMGDRTKGAQAAFFNSKMFNTVAQFQLEVNNQMYSMFYDTYHESKEKANGNALKMAAGMTFTLGQLFAFTHVFGQAFEKVAGYNPTFDVIEIIKTLLGIDDEEEKTFDERFWEATEQLANALPYASTLTGGRIPIAQALPVKEFLTGKDEYGNEQKRLKTLAEAAPYYLLPAGGSQAKKTVAGLKMFDKDNPVPGSYTDKGDLRFPVEDKPANRAQAAVFGQWANENAQEYIDGEHKPLGEEDIQEYKDLKIPIKDYWEYKEGMPSGEGVKQEDKMDYIANLPLPVKKKNIMANNIADRKDPIDLTDYEKYGSFALLDYAQKNPDNYAVSKTIGKLDYYLGIKGTMYSFEADKDEHGNSISGSKKEKIIDYLDSTDLNFAQKAIMLKSVYTGEDRYNDVIYDYVNSNENLTEDDRRLIYERLKMD